ncbi:MAG: O-methyltransferase [Bacteroidota bacterium]|nr:O-methyltransferase [Bacteroidota bacterium]
MEFIDKKLSDYAELHTTPESALLQQINRDTHANVMMSRMLSGHLQGRVLAMFSAMIQPKYILEIGTYTGYSAICMAEHLNENGKLISIDINEELRPRIQKNWSSFSKSNQMELMIGNAIEIIPTLNYTFDLVFIDADKINYANYFDLVIDKVRSGGFIIADNVLWSGKVVENPDPKDKDLQSILKFNAYIQKHDAIENVLFPIRDGLMVMRKC